MKTLVRTDRDISWIPQPGEGRFYLTDEVPARAQCSTAFGFVFVDERILLTKLHRGWDIPGGVIEPGETPEAAAVRETWEETYARVEVVELLGSQELETFAPQPEPYRWPYPISIQLYYLCRLIEWQPFVVNDESIERGLFAPSEARGLATIQHHAPLYEAGLQRVQRYNFHS